MDRKHYPSDVSSEQFEPIRNVLEGARHRTRPRRVDLYDVFCAILYLLKNAAVWRALPSDFPAISTVRYYFDLWNGRRTGAGTSLLAQALKNQVEKKRVQAGKQPSTRFCIVDAQSVKNTETARHKGYDAGKKVAGIKRHIAVDTQGLPHAIGVTTADVTDRAGALAILSRPQ